MDGIWKLETLSSSQSLSPNIFLFLEQKVYVQYLEALLWGGMGSTKNKKKSKSVCRDTNK